jgi:hypothetical protein
VSQTNIPGYTFGTDAVAHSPVSLGELELLRATLLLGEDDLAALRRSGDLLAGRVEEILDVWYGFVGANPHLLAAFTGPDGRPDQAYLAAVRRRFGRWILDTARAEDDQAWLDYQHEIGLRHHRSGKNRTDSARAAEHIPLGTCSPCWCPSRRRSSRSWPRAGPPRMRSRRCTRPGSRRSCSRSSSNQALRQGARARGFGAHPGL